MIALALVVAAALGAGLRHLVNGLGFGWIGTLTINVVGSFALGLLVGHDPGDGAATVLGVGLLGSITTFSTFSLEAVEQPVGRRILLVSGSLALGVGAASLGVALA